MKRRSSIVLSVLIPGLLTITVLCIGCQKQQFSKESYKTAVSHRKIKSVIIMIADGMGFQSVGLLNSYAKYAPDSIYRSQGRTTALERVIEAGVLGYAYHEPANALVVDSAASATQMASGKRALPETIGIDRFGNPTETILEKAKKLGKSVGLVSDTRITHATPAGFAANQTHRSMENEIAVDLLNSDIDVMLSGGLRHWIPIEASDKKSEIHKQLRTLTRGSIEIKSKRKDSRNLLGEIKQRGYSVIFTKAQLDETHRDKLLGLFSYSVIPYRIDLDLKDRERAIPTLKEMTVKALAILSTNEKGFFLMVESGLIDWAAHDNDAGSLLHELIRFDETLACIYDWVKERNDTLLIVSADHETGGFSFSYSRNNIPEPVDFPGEIFKKEKFAPQYNFGSIKILDKIYKQKSSYKKIMDIFDSLPEEEQSPEVMAQIVNDNTEFHITGHDAAAILETEENEYYVEGHAYLGNKRFPKITDFKEFYVYSDDIRRDILGRVVAKHQNAVWSTGTHTNTPVPLIVLGPKEATEKFGKMLHTTEWAQYTIDALLNNK